jgi:pyruvate/2-oxoglutarate dehydrogenase complex dihydrolipoamide dehydrogenase (E3) component/uncharacterized membrane protein YdjX (TVP38/TMEM64 family)
MGARRFLLVVAGAGAAAAFVAAGGTELLRLDALKVRHVALQTAFAVAPWTTAGIYVAVYVAAAALSVPGAAVLTLAGGAIFGFATGLVLVSIASTIGATLAFLASRFLLRDAVRRRFGPRLAPIEAGIARDGAFYLLTLRLVPVVPFFVVNLLMGLTPIAVPTFVWVSQLGMLPATAAYVNAGTQLAAVTAVGDVLSPRLLAPLALLGLLPLGGRLLVRRLRARAVYAPWRHLRPKRFDRDLVVVGGGSAGLVSAYLAAAVQARVTLVERQRMGGDCLYTGCVPSKTLLRAARAATDIRRGPEFGVHAGDVRVDFAAVMARVREVIRAIEPHDSADRYTRLGVECLRGHGRLTSPWSVEVAKADGTSTTLTARTIVIATGASPSVPAVPGLAEAGPLTSETVWQLDTLPRRLIVLGGGPIGCELAQAFARLGAQVTLVEQGPRLLAREDAECAALVAEGLAADGIVLRLQTRAVRVEGGADARRLVVEGGGATDTIPFDAVLCATGRVPHTAGLGLETLGIRRTAAGAIEVDDRLATIFPNVLACGDVVSPYQFTHAASHTAWYAVVNGLFGWLRTFRVDYAALPWATFTDPEVARVGLNEAEAAARGIPCEVTTYALAELDRAIADGAPRGFVKVLTAPGRDRVLGATVVGAHASELIGAWVTALRHGLGLQAVLATIHAYPTFAEANKYAAGVWRRGRVTGGQRTFLAAVHAWRRGEASFGGVVAALWPLWRHRRRAE